MLMYYIYSISRRESTVYNRISIFYDALHDYILCTLHLARKDMWVDVNHRQVGAHLSFKASYHCCGRRSRVSRVLSAEATGPL